jgi:hypothetical protein
MIDCSDAPYLLTLGDTFAAVYLPPSGDDVVGITGVGVATAFHPGSGLLLDLVEID